MVADNKKKSASDDAQPLSESKVSDSHDSSLGKLSPHATSKKGLFVVGVLVVGVLIVGGIILKNQLHIGEKVYAQAAGHKVYKQDIQELIGNTRGVTDREAATVLANKYLTEAMAKDADITVSNQDLVASYGAGVNKEKTDEPYVYQLNVNNAYFDKLSAYNAGYYKGKLIVANFSRYIPFESPLLDTQKVENPLIGNVEAAAQDKKYAKDFITNLYKQIQAGKITFDQAIQKEHDNPYLGVDAYVTLAHSGAFDTSNVGLGGTALILPESIQPRISKMKAGQTSLPFVVSVNNSLNNKGTTTESYYLIVRMDSTSGGHSGLTYDQYLAQSKKSLGYKIYA